jgi:nitrogen fixation-related uncharacterized protein
MEIIVLQVFVSLVLVAGSVVLFVWTVRGRTLEHADRLSLAPLDDDARPPTAATDSPRPPGADS